MLLQVYENVSKNNFRDFLFFCSIIYVLAILSSTLPAVAFVTSFGAKEEETVLEEEKWGVLDMVAGFSALALLVAAFYGLFLAIPVFFSELYFFQFCQIVKYYNRTSHIVDIGGNRGNRGNFSGQGVRVGGGDMSHIPMAMPIGNSSVTGYRPNQGGFRDLEIQDVRVSRNGRRQNVNDFSIGEAAPNDVMVNDYPNGNPFLPGGPINRPRAKF